MSKDEPASTTRSGPFFRYQETHLKGGLSSPPPPHNTKVLYIEVGGMVGCKYEAGVKRGGGQKNFV